MLKSAVLNNWVGGSPAAGPFHFSGHDPEIVKRWHEMGDYPKRREGDRTSVTWPAVVMAGADRMPCAIIDVSSRGAKLELPNDIPEKAAVILICPKFGSLDGYVVWRKGSYAGIRFTDPGAATSLKPFLGASAGATVTATVKFGRRPKN